MRHGLALAVAFASLLASAVALACGASFGPSIRIDPRQDIVLSWKDGVETYVFQPTFCGSATEFGLILPVPAQLSQNPTLVDPQVFSSAKRLSEPNKKLVNVPAGGIGCGAGADGLKGGVNGDTTTVVASGRVGLLDWVQLAADTTASFTDWLEANGYPYSTSSSNAFSYYVAKRWYFLAFRINQDAVSGTASVCRALGPVALSFPTPVPVLPSRMAMASSNQQSGHYDFQWRIFGITRGDAELAFAEGLSTDRQLWYSGAIGASEAPSFSGLADPGDRLTRLTLRFSFDLYNPSQAAEDVGLALAPARDYRGTEEVYVYDDSACSLSGGRRPAPSFLLILSGLALCGLFGWRRWR